MLLLTYTPRRAARYTRKHSAETRAKISKAMVGRTFTAEHKAKLKKSKRLRREQDKANGVKLCKTCKIVKKLEFFLFLRSRDAYVGECKQCHSARVSLWCRMHRASCSEAQKKRKQNNKEKYQALSKACYAKYKAKYPGRCSFLKKQRQFRNPEHYKLLQKYYNRKLIRTLGTAYLCGQLKYSPHLTIDQLRAQIIATRSKRIHQRSSDLVFSKAIESIKNIHNKKNKGNC